MKNLSLSVLLLLAGGGVSHAAVQKTVFSADVVASACHVVVDVDSTGNSGRLTFGTYRKSTGASVPPRDFAVRLYESGATVQGCSAFKAGRVATLDFGNPGQLDAGGVVTRGAGDGIRVDVRAVDAEARTSDTGESFGELSGGICCQGTVPFSCAAGVSGEREGGGIHRRTDLCGHVSVTE